MVIFEAARAICNLRDVTARELSPAITVLQLFLSSSKPVLRFAAGRCGGGGWCVGVGGWMCGVGAITVPQLTSFWAGDPVLDLKLAVCFAAPAPHISPPAQCARSTGWR
jgi:hypothetical protein